MDYSQLVEALYLFMPNTRLSKKSSFVLAGALDKALGSPSKQYPIVHVAGTNGKGSVVSKIAEACSLAGYKVGVFTSPHLHCLRERIQINQEKISEEEFLACGEKVFAAIKEKVYFFEIITCMALEYFSQKKADLVILETGIGGRFDSTNFVTPILSIITSISYDHCSLLGSTLEEIGAQKAGIIKEKIPAVLGPSAQIEIIEREAEEKDAPLLRSHCFGGFFDEENSAIAKIALSHLASSFLITQENILLGIQYRPPCRFEVFSSSELNIKHSPEYVILDVAHNPDGFRKLIEAIRLKLNKKPLRFFIGISKDKELKECLQVLAKHASFIHLAPVNHFKLLKPKVIKEALLSIGFTRCSCEEGLQEALKEAATQDELLVICGSFYIMTEVKEIILLKK